MIGIKPMPKFDAQPLLTLVKRVEAAPDVQFDMESFADETACGTTGCMVGWDAVGRIFERRGQYLSAKVVNRYCCRVLDEDCSRKAYSISRNEWRWLFSATETDSCGEDKCPSLLAALAGLTGLRWDKAGWSKDRNLNRVRKLIWWKLRKQEIMANDDARHIEGDWNLAAEAKGELCGA